MPLCPVTGRSFEVSDAERALRKKLGIEGDPIEHPVVRFQRLAAFWQHWALHKRKCDRTGKQIVAVFPEDCPYPVWHKDEWIKHADPPSAEADLTKPIFPQLWEVFRRSPIAHNTGVGNENCEYTDDWWYSKNCYLSHSGLNDEDLRYCYRVYEMKNDQYCVFSYASERCVDLINSHRCFRVTYALNSWQCTESAFLYDCRGCNHCLFCSNLRNKSYCIGNVQLSKEEYERQAQEWDFRSRATYENAKQVFLRMLRTQSWHRSAFIDLCQGCETCNYINESKECTNCFFVDELEDSVNVLRGFGGKDSLDTVCAAVGVELVYCSAAPQDKCYDVKYTCNVMQCKDVEYCMHCFQCEHCFGCCGLVGKKYCILNKQYAPEEYAKRKAEIIAAMKKTGEYGTFFPGYFAPNVYEESIGGFYWPMTSEEGRKRGFRMREQEPERSMDALDAAEIPDRSDAATNNITEKVFWDTVAKRPFQIAQADIDFARDLGAPLPYTYYMRRLQENFRLIPFSGELRTTKCGKCGVETQTSWPEEYDGRILCENCYLKEVY